MSDIPRNEYPRPDFVREQWQCLNGTWEFAFDDSNQGLAQSWFDSSHKLEQSITVPFAYQTKASGIHVSEHHSVVWYARDFVPNEGWADQRVLLHFGAVDYEATVWVNGVFVGQHAGGYVPFSFDITDVLHSGANRVTVRVVDDVRIDQPRGKQTARKGQWGCWYTPVTGIWQTVWLESVAATRLTELHLVPDIDTESLHVKYGLSKIDESMAIELAIQAEDHLLSNVEIPLRPKFNKWSDVRPEFQGSLTLPVPNSKLWSPEHPFLYDLALRIRVDGTVVDEVRTYFGMRKVEAIRGQVFLNNQPYYQRLILDQGYWPDGLYTAPSADALRRDVELTKACGFNGARKHQKIEDPYYYYYADKLGLLVWSEMPATYEYDDNAAANLRREWAEAIKRDRNHPSIIAWTPLNESWGIDQIKKMERPEIIAYMHELYFLTHSLDGTRLVISNDGWQQATTDLITIHEYTQDADDLARKLQAFEGNPHLAAFSHGRPILLPEYEKGQTPVLVTEFGGTRVAAQGAEGWGYGSSATDYEQWLGRISRLVETIVKRPSIVGYCYTQLTDVQQEVNGLLTFDHQPKVDVELIKKVFTQR